MKIIKYTDTDTARNNITAEHIKNSYTNPVRKAKHFPPATKEWTTSIYAYNNSNAKDYSEIDKMTAKLIRSYLNLYSSKLRKRIRKYGSKRFEIRKSRRHMSKIFIGKPELKHNTDTVSITVYVYNNEIRSLINNVNNMPSTYITNNKKTPSKVREQSKLAISKLNKSKISYLKKTNKLSTNIRSKLINEKRLFLTKNCNIDKAFISTNNYNSNFIRSYVKKSFRKEIFSTHRKQMITFNKRKFEKIYITSLANNAAKLYKKKIQFNFVSLKHIYLDSRVFSMALITKLRRLARTKKSFLLGLKQFMLMFKIPPVNSLHTYNEIFNRQLIDQNVNNNNILHNSKFNNIIEIRKEQDIADNTLSVLDFINESDFGRYKTFNKIIQYVSTINKGFNTIKYKTINGVRLEIAGRFTKSSSAARSVFKIRNKGSIRNKDSSHKGLKAVLLKGYAKSNLQYNKVYSKVRGGSFGIKSSLSGA